MLIVVIKTGARLDLTTLPLFRIILSLSKILLFLALIKLINQSKSRALSMFLY